ncbi:hypothetical protein IEQ34_005836 [Dendrobium chrysotoxum]|uniref:BAHD acyltransferase DCR n=1 Tax=Dendrobium chrysotoxum TaxID=161865 RepID=A0AAV7HCJ4_DENCH|nr:hypothetical protein IEQ34_005836 [Dendrobium chrysotoxum]
MTVPVSIVAFQSITPAKVTPPGKSRQISVVGNLPPASLSAHFRLILYYRPAGASVDNSAHAVGAWMKETLSLALAEEPLFAGRIRRSEAENGGWEVRFNDAGVRLVLAKAAAKMAEVLDAGDREEREWGLVYWRDVERENPDQSALCYIQITDFQDSGYCIGISCSLLLADPLFLIRFLLKWAHTHSQLTAPSSLATSPIFYLTNFRPSPLPAHLAAVSTVAPPTSTILFHLPPTTGKQAGAWPSAGNNFTFLRSDHAGNVKVEFCVNGGEERGGGDKTARWEELGAGDLVLGDKNVPVGVSYRIVPGGDGAGAVIAMVPSDGSDVLVSVTVPAPVSVSAKS